jgi:hypothetical protein
VQCFHCALPVPPGGGFRFAVLGAELERMPGYALGFFFMWVLTAASSALTVFLERSAEEVNRPGDSGA